ncbi:hypothetical protein JN03_0376 [Metamycoplasma hyosynoviae]|uniref:Uncharacterized protein n=2 Tax=Metamycoplasma hyosynoviae TaxID=29559 RepID=A0A4R7TZR0_9BACT|nr:hypothetical protein JN03_0376 [Metamycoplasma hyosynoviae]
MKKIRLDLEKDLSSS